jgi:hypothetical protein
MKTVIFTTTSKNKIDDFKTFLEYKNLTNEINLLTLSDIHIPDGEVVNSVNGMIDSKTLEEDIQMILQDVSK